MMSWSNERRPKAKRGVGSCPESLGVSTVTKPWPGTHPWGQWLPASSTNVLKRLAARRGVAAYGELLRHPLTILTPDDAHRYAAVAAWPLLHRCHDSRRSVPTWEHLGLTLSRRVVPKMFP